MAGWLQRRVVALGAIAWAATAGAGAQAIAHDALFDWAEQSYSSLFPGHAATQTYSPYVYRYYPTTGNHLGVADQGVYVMGPVSNGQLLRVGAVSDFACLVAPDTCPHATAPDLGRVARMAHGYGYTLAVRRSGEVLVWGSGATGQRTPVPGTVTWQIDGLSGVVGVYATFRGTNLALTADGRVFGWGNEISGNLGSATTEVSRQVTVPIQVPGITGVVDVVPTVIGSNRVSYYMLRHDGTVWSSPGATGPSSFAVPQQVPGLPRIVALSEYQATLDVVGSAGQQAFGIDELGQVWNLIAVSGPGPYTQRVEGLRDIMQVSCTDIHCLALDRSGDVWAWGRNANGQLGDGTRIDRMLPAKVGGLKRVRKVVATGHASFALTSSAVYSWGMRAATNLPTSLVPTAILPHANAIVDLYPSFDIPAGSRFMVYRDGVVKGSGLNYQGVLGDGTSKDALIDTAPVAVRGVNLGGI